MSSVLVTTLPFSEITKSDFPKVGLKGAYIGEMVHARIPLPPGFIITTESYFYFLDMARVREKIVDILANLNVENPKDLEEASNLIQDIIMKATVPPAIENSVLKAYSRLSGFVNTFVAVRSSISYDDSDQDSFAGMSSTFLNIKGSKDVMLALKACWASMFEPNAIYYRSVKGMSHMKAGMSVIIQKMIQAEVSGVMFTTNPLKDDNNKIIIEAVLGLGDIIEADAITPDHYEITKSGMVIDVKQVAKQGEMIIRSQKTEEEEQIKKVQVAQKWQNVQKLDDKRIVELAQIGKLIEQQFGTPQDIEWVMEAGKLFILQSRALLQKNEQPVIEQKVEQIITTAPVQEILQPQIEQPAPQPQSIDEPQILLSGSPASEGVAEGKVVIVSKDDDFIKLNTGDILVIDKIIPDYILWMRKAAAIITNTGGMTSHAAILSREFSIPCIVGTENATDILQDGEVIQVNGTNGRVYLIAEKTELPSAEIKQESQVTTPIVEEPLVKPEAPPVSIPFVQVAIEPELPVIPTPIKEPTMQVVYERHIEPPQVSSTPPHITNIKTATKVMVNATDQIPSILADGIGYINGTDILNNRIGKHPESFIEEEIVEKYVTQLAGILEEYCKAASPNPVIYHPSNLDPETLTFDISKYEQTERNPLLGYNGAIKYAQNPSLFNMEIEAIKTVRNKFGYKNLSLLLPMVRDAKDLREIKKIITSNDLKRSSTFKIYLPIEAPSSILLINELLDIGVDGIFVFVKKLSGLLNAVDTTNPRYKSFDIYNNAFMMSMEVLLKTAHKNKAHTGIILEEDAIDKHSLRELIGWGTMMISVSAHMVDQTKAVVADIEKDLILSRRS